MLYCNNYRLCSAPPELPRRHDDRGMGVDAQLAEITAGRSVIVCSEGSLRL